MINKYLLEKSCKQSLLDFAMKHDKFKNELTFKEHVELCNFITNLSYNESVSLVFNNGNMLTEFGIRDFESKFRKFIKYGIAAIAGGVIGGGPVGLTVGAILYYMFRKATDPCWQSCVRKFGRPHQRRACKYRCQAEACRAIINDIRAEKAKCSNTKNPLSCERKLDKALITWTQRLQENLIKQREAETSSREKEARKKEKERKKEEKARQKGK